LQQAFLRKPFQGAAPETAKYLFVGLDANYDEFVEKSPTFDRILEYLDDGVAFWTSAGIHHPFLLPGYNGDGRKYHRTFSQIGFRPADASKVSFIELVDVPTFGTSSLVPGDLSRSHLERLDHAIRAGGKYVFVSDRVGRLMNASGCFPWMARIPANEGGPLKIWYRDETTTVYWHYHFSVYGKFEQEKRNQLAAIRALVEREERPNGPSYSSR
jgi:hypothetical protein